MQLGNRRSPRRQGPKRTVSDKCGNTLAHETWFALGMFASCCAIVAFTALMKQAGVF